MKNLIYKKEKLAQELQDSLRQRAHKLNTAYVSFKRLNLGEISLEELTSVVSNFKQKDAESYIREKIYESNQTLKALPLNKEDVLKIIQLPVGFESFYKAIDALILPYGVQYPSIKFFKISNESIVLNEETVAEFIDKNYCFYLDTKEEQDAYDLILQIKSLLEKTQPFFNGQMNNALLGGSKGAVLIETEGEISLDPRAFIYHIKNIKNIYSL